MYWRKSHLWLAPNLNIYTVHVELGIYVQDLQNLGPMYNGPVLGVTRDESSILKHWIQVEVLWGKKEGTLHVLLSIYIYIYIYIHTHTHVYGSQVLAIHVIWSHRCIYLLKSNKAIRINPFAALNFSFTTWYAFSLSKFINTKYLFRTDLILKP